MKKLLLCIAAAGSITCSDGGSGPGPTPTRLSFTTQPGDAIVDTAAGDIKVSVLDQNGAVLTTATTNVTLDFDENPSGASLSGQTTVGAVAGVATFTDITLSAVGSGYTLVATASGLVPDTSAAFDVTLSFNDSDGDTFSPHTGDCNDGVAAIHPGATDHPDASFIDFNCDGIDGERDNATFVSQSTGVDDSGCGTEAMPCATIQVGINRAVGAGVRDVYVVAGHYAGGAFTMADGVSVYGGFSLTYQRSSSNVATVVGNRDFPVDGGTQSMVVFAEDLTQPTVLADLRLTTADALDRLPSAEGKSVYAIVVRNVPAGVLTIARNVVVVSTASVGRLGDNGANATTLSGLTLAGQPGGPADEPAPVFCNSTSRGSGGAAGTVGGSGGTLSPVAGDGGDGGTMDTGGCGGISPNLTATAGDNGVPAVQLGAGRGAGGLGGSGADACGNPEAGQPGRVTNGDGGNGAGTGGRLIGDFWYARNGGDGEIGDNGGGGGGGGGSGGCDVGTDSYGAGGGGGGAGGQLALGPGGGGGGGGGAFGIYLVDASPTISDNTITRGNGGNGAAGGVGGRGQSGGLGGAGGLAAGDSKAGGRGGDGGHGGHGGGGGGGAGGISFAIYLVGGSAPTLGANAIQGGTAGQGGAGGASAPSAPVAERDGNPGTSGVGGTLGTIGSCAAPTGC